MNMSAESWRRVSGADGGAGRIAHRSHKCYLIVWCRWKHWSNALCFDCGQTDYCMSFLWGCPLVSRSPIMGSAGQGCTLTNVRGWAGGSGSGCTPQPQELLRDWEALRNIEAMICVVVGASSPRIIA